MRDVSRSVPLDQQQLADTSVDASTRNKPAGDRVGVVNTARHAAVRAMPGTLAPAADAPRAIDAMGTYLYSAIRLARGLIPSDAAGHVLLILAGECADPA